MAQVVTKFKVDTAEYDAKIAKAKGRLNSFGKSGAGAMDGFTKAISANVMKFASWTAVIAGAGKVFGDMVRINREFEQANANLSAILGVSKNNMTALTEQAKRLGATTMFTASQVTQLQTELAKLGFTQSEIQSSTQAVLDFSAATGADLGGAAALCGAALRSWGLDAKEMGRVASAMAVSTTKSALSYEKLQASLSTVAPVAAKFGFSIEDTLALLGKLSDAGFDASSAATATRNIFLNMADSSGKLAKALGRPIKSLDDLGPALQELNAKGIDLASMLELTDKRSVAAFATLVSGSGTLTDLRDSITGCSDALGGMVDKQMNTLEGSTKIMQSAWEGLMLTFSNSTGILKSVTDSLGEFLGAWAEWRARRQGGEGAIATYGADVDTKAVDEKIKKLKEQGATDQSILAGTQKKKEAAEQERQAYKDLYDQLLQIEQLKGREHDTAQEQWNKDFRAMFPDYSLQKGDGNAKSYVERQIAKKNTAINTAQYAIDTLTPKEVKIEAKEVKTDAPVETKSDKSKDTFKLGDYRAMPQAGSLADLEAQAAMVRNSMGGATTAEEYKEMQDHLDILTEKMKALRGETEQTFAPGSLNDLNQQLREAQECLNEVVVGSEAWYEALENVKTAQEAVNAAQAQINPKVETAKDTAKGTGDAWQAAANAIQAAGNAMSQIDDPAAKVAGTLTQAVASIMLGFAQASASPATGAAGVFGWIAASLSGLATAISMVTTIKSVTSGFAEGGMVLPNGNPYGGDNIVARLNAGEGVLTERGIANAEAVAGQLQQNGMAGGVMVQGESTVTGEQIKIAYNNYAKRRGVKSQLA